MEVTRHFVATVYVVNDDATLLHKHPTLDLWLPPGGHLQRDELPHEAAQREVKEETGLDVELISPHGEIDTPSVRALPQPNHLLLEDINVCHNDVGHQHIDFIFYGKSSHRKITPVEGEAPPDVWVWVTMSDLEPSQNRFASDVVEIGRKEIETIHSQ